MPPTDAQRAATLENARRFMAICNACRYCEGYCAVFPAMELRNEFSRGDLHYLANLCHDCRGCYYACPFTPPHEFQLNLPKTFSLLRADTYAEYAWPRPLAAAFARNGGFVALVTSLSVAAILLLTAHLQASGAAPLAAYGPGAFYAIIPEIAMTGTAALVLLFTVLALLLGFRNFWRDAGGGPLPGLAAMNAALGDILTLRNLGGSHGCNDLDAQFSRSRRYAHHALFYGFLLCFASTSVAAIYEHVFGIVAPYPFLSLPVLLGTAGGIGMVLGATGLIGVKVMRDQAPVAKAVFGSDYALLNLLLFAAATGLLLLAARRDSAMPVLLALHLGLILSFFLLMPYSKFVHSIYRSAALLRNAGERLPHSDSAVVSAPKAPARSGG